MERIVIPNKATYVPVALSDLIMGAPLATRVLLGASGPGQVLAAGAAGFYVASALQDWLARRGARPIDFLECYGADVHQLEPMPDGMRMAEMRELAARLSDAYLPRRMNRQTTARRVDRALTRYIASVTGQEIVSSSEVRSFTLASIAFPFALGSCDPIGGDVAIYQDTGVLEPHVIAHEFCHRKGYLKELHAQVLAFLALRNSGVPELVQSARAERLHRHLSVWSDTDVDRWHATVDALPLRTELAVFFHALRPREASEPGAISRGMRALYDRRMRLTGQNGLSDYDRGFTDFLWTFRHASGVRMPHGHADL